MARIVFCWELGSNLGHISQFSNLAQALKDSGHELYFICRELHLAETVFGPGSGLHFLQAPLFPLTIKTSRSPYTYSEILQCNGYANTSALHYMIKAWRSLFQLIQPNLLVCDYAPTALLAAKDLTIPKVEIGTSFSVQALTTPMSCLDSHQNISLTQRQKADDIALSAINSALSQESLRPLKAVKDIFADTRQWLLTYPELDSVKERHNVQYMGAIIPEKRHGTMPNWQSKKEKTKVFGYLRSAYINLENILSYLRKSDFEVKLFIAGATAKLIQTYQSAHLEISQSPYNISSAIAHCDFVISHGGSATPLEALLAGKPSLLFPQYGEQAIYARQFEKMHYGLAATANSSEQEIGVLMTTLSQEKRFQQAAEDFAKKYREDTPGSNNKRIGKGLLELLD